MPKIFITGGIGSGKTYAADYLSKRYGYRHVSLDGLFFDLQAKTHREKKSPELRDAELMSCLNGGKAIFEGLHFGEWLTPLYQKVDLVIFIETPLEVRIERLSTRYARRKQGLEHDPFPMGGEDHLQNLIKWTKMYDREKAEQEVRSACAPTCQFTIVSGDIQNCDLDQYFTTY